MSSNLKLKLLLDHVDNISGPLKTITQGSKKTSKQLQAQQRVMKELQKQQNNIESYQRLRKETRNLGKEFDTAKEKTNALQKEIDATQNPTKGLIRKFEQAEKASNKLEEKHKSKKKTLRKLKKELKESGVATQNLTKEEKRLATEMDVASSAIDKQKRNLSALHKAKARVNKITAAGGRVLSESGALVKKGLVAAGVGGLFFKTQLLDTAAEFENYEAILQVVEGTSDKARSALDWSSSFASKTPFQLNAITEAFVRLRTYGLDPTNGLMETLGDTSAAMGVPLLQSVEAIADAITGENERLKELGITASKAGEKTTFNYVDKNDKQQAVTVDGNDRKAIEAALKTIWNEKFKGASEKRAKTWEGMLSNMGDHWKNFSMKIMSGGLFDWMKTKLGSLLDKINQMAADGTLQKLAKDWGNKLTTFATGVWNVGNAIVDATSYMSKLVGGGETLVLLLGGISLAPLIASFVALGIAIGPVGLAIAGIVGAGALIYKNWAGVSDWLSNTFDKILIALGPLGSAIKYLIEGAKYIYKNWDTISNFFSSNDSKETNNQGTFGNVTQSIKATTPVTKTPITRSANNAGSKTVIEKINIHPSPGMDETQLANKVAAAIAENERKKSARQRSQMRDTE